MAIFLSNYSLAPPLRLSTFFSSSKPFKTTLAFQSLHHRPLFKTIVGFPPINTARPSFNAFFTINGKEGFQDDVEVSGSEVGEKHLSDVKKLIEAYKEAIIDGDEKTMSDIEARICVIENVKNELLQKVSALSAEITSGKEKHIRLQADFDNFRKRMEKERSTIRSDAQGEVIESLLLMVDSFESAKQQIKPETEKEKKIDSSYQGIYKQFVEIMRSMQVAAVPTVGKPFDPSTDTAHLVASEILLACFSDIPLSICWSYIVTNSELHEAIAREESEEFKEGIVIQEVRRGFLIGNRLLRPATVKVSAGPGRKKAPVPSQKSAGQHAAAASRDEQ
ncbi:hypothetical protein Pint_08262 [Pistacia integerrima]|uniref:Uncharacterized protein n=1 Tax=Pistacia integerrima TaxID=434235 RepID=A0ACC0XU28_9ROSI|nr:hypothetical protein Pint_08262 [Pistacia integerrima]